MRKMNANRRSTRSQTQKSRPLPFPAESRSNFERPPILKGYVYRGLHPQVVWAKLTTPTNWVPLMLDLLIAIVSVLIGIAVYQRARKPRSLKRGTERDVSPMQQRSGSAEETAKAQKGANEVKQEIHGPYEEAGIHETPTTEATRNSERSDYPENHAEAGVDRPRPETPSPVSSGESVCRGEESQQETEEARQLDPQSNQPQPAAGIQAPQLEAADRQQAKGTSVEPAQRGGRPRSTRDDGGKESAGHKARQPKPEIVCWKSEQQWIPAVEVAEKFLEDPRVGVVQNGQPLTRDESREGCWRMCQISGNLVVSSGEDGLYGRDTISLDEGFLLFKLSGESQNQGRRVRYASYGSYLVISPDSWTRDESLSGPAPFDPEPVSLPEYRAHFFKLPKGALDRIAFRTPGENSVGIDSKSPDFALVGNQLIDANEEVGPLFGGGPPRIRGIDAKAWNDVETIVVGEEGRGGGKWRMTFKPSTKSIEQDLPPEVAARKGGWYFVRFYDLNDDLVESLDFRFASGLTKITMTQPQPLPSEEGHQPITVEFSHAVDCFVESAGRSQGTLAVSDHAGITTVVIPEQPAFDQTYWRVRQAPSVSLEIELLVERIWWSYGEECFPPSQTRWSDKPLSFHRQEFRAISKTVLYLWMPKLRWADAVLVGFTEDRKRRYKTKTTERYVAIPLRDFGDATEIQEPFQAASLTLWIERDGALDGGIVIGRVFSAFTPGETPPIQPVLKPSQTESTADRVCSFCDHAVTKKGVVRCRRDHWYRESRATFDRVHAGFSCNEWRGEYKDAEGNWRS